MSIASDESMLKTACAGAVAGAIVGGVGCFFVPAIAVAAGGALATMGACAIGAAVFSTPIQMIYERKSDYADAGIIWNAMRFALKAVYMYVIASFAIDLGAAVVGVAAMPVFACALIGTLAVMAVAALIMACKILSDTISPKLNERVDAPVSFSL